MSSVKWKDIAGYEGLYQVSNDGRVRSLDRVTCNGSRRKGKILKPILNNKGHYTVGLSNGKAKMKQVHKLVIEAFIGPYPKGMETCHGSLGKQNNTLKNLRYATSKENSFDRYRDGTMNNKPVKCIETNTIYRSVREAGRETGTTPSNISSACKNYICPKGKRHLTAGGYHWEFV